MTEYKKSGGGEANSNVAYVCASAHIHTQCAACSKKKTTSSAKAANVSPSKVKSKEYVSSSGESSGEDETMDTTEKKDSDDSDRE